MECDSEVIDVHAGFVPSTPAQSRVCRGLRAQLPTLASSNTEAMHESRQESGQWRVDEEARHVPLAYRRCKVFLFASRGFVGQQHARHTLQPLRVSSWPGFSQQMTCRRELRLSASDSAR